MIVTFDLQGRVDRDFAATYHSMLQNVIGVVSDLVHERVSVTFDDLESALRFLRIQVNNPLVRGIQMTVEDIHDDDE